MNKAIRHHDICNEFETRYELGERPSIYQALQQVPRSERKELKAPLLEIKARYVAQRASRVRAVAGVSLGLSLAVAFLAVQFWIVAKQQVLDAAAGRLHVPEGWRLVEVTTEPSGAEVYLVPYSPSGMLAPYRMRQVGRSPLQFAAMPGEYLLVTHIGSDMFHEVNRIVPGDYDTPGILPHNSWKEDGELVSLPLIKLFSQQRVTSNMGLFEGGEFEMGHPRSNYNIRHTREIAPFHLDLHETTKAEFVGSGTDNSPQGFVTFDQAVSYLESIGKRLPHEAEYEFAATNQGATKFPWGNDPYDKKWSHTATKIDVVNSMDGRAVCGLGSGVGEWCSEPWYFHFNGRPMRPPPDHHLTRVVRGSPNVAMADPDDDGDGHTLLKSSIHTSRSRTFVLKDTAYRGLGMRGARSAAPRTRPEMFDSLTRRPMPHSKQRSQE